MHPYTYVHKGVTVQHTYIHTCMHTHIHTCRCGLTNAQEDKLYFTVKNPIFFERQIRFTMSM